MSIAHSTPPTKSPATVIKPIQSIAANFPRGMMAYPPYRSIQRSLRFDISLRACKGKEASRQYEQDPQRDDRCASHECS